MKNNRFLYNLRGFGLFLTPKFFLRSKKNSILKNALTRKDRDYIFKRVHYLCRLQDFKKLQQSDGGGGLATLKENRLGKRHSVYFFDTFEFSRYFPDTFKWFYEKGDVNYFLPQPSITKSRPISRDKRIFKNNHLEYKNTNSVLLNIDKVRHFIFLKDPYKYEAKKDILFFRGNCYQPHRKKFLEMYFDHSLCDLGQVGNSSKDLMPYLKPKTSIKNHLEYKFILSLEGNDVASNLKWIMSSNSVAIMPKPKFETWFMEGKLIGDYHYIEINDDYSNLEEKLHYFLKHPLEAKRIRENANNYVKQFFDKEREKIISLLVLEKYFYHTLQTEPIEELKDLL